MRLIIPPIEIDPNDPFKHDLFNRKEFAESLATFFSNVEDPLVMALDGAWGVGKSTFVKMLDAHLRTEGFLTKYIDAFAIDYVEDPFVPISMEIAQLIEKEQDGFGKAKDFTKKTIHFVGKVFGKFAYTGINIVTQGALKEFLDKDEASKLAEKLSELGEEMFEQRLRKYMEEKAAISDFKSRLEEIANESFVRREKPIIIFVDELDRCKPSFAVNFIERIKHFFSVPNIIFVLIANKTQLETAIRTTYGSEVDANTYLQKFVSAWVKMPDFKNIDGMDSRRRYIERLIQAHRFDLVWDRDRGHLEFLIKEIASWYDLSLREIESILTNLAFARASFYGKQYIWIEKILLITALIKIISPKIYDAWIIRAESPEWVEHNHPLYEQKIFRHPAPQGPVDKSQFITDYILKPFQEAYPNRLFSSWPYVAEKLRNVFSLAKIQKG